MIFDNEIGMSSSMGFVSGRTGPHLARSLMHEELYECINYLKAHPGISYREAVIDENCLNKDTMKNRVLTAKHLSLMYGMEEDSPIPKGLRYFMTYADGNYTLLALLCALARDPLLRYSASFIFSYKYGEHVARVELEQYIDKMERGRYSPAMLKSLSQNLNGSWTFSGYLKGKRDKVRSKVSANAAAVSYAAYLSTLRGNSGFSVLTDDFMKVLECREDEAIAKLREASSMGIITLNKIGDVMEIAFSKSLESR